MLGAFQWDGSGVAALILAALAAAGAVDRFWWKRRHKGHVDAVEKMEEIKTELMGHITANRVQSDRLTRRTAEHLQTRIDEGHSVLLEMMTDLETKVTKRANTSSSRVSSKVPVSAEKVGSH